MTGHLGERTNHQVALVTDDFRLYHELAPFFEARGIQLLGLAPGEPIPDAVEVLLDGPPADPRSVPVRPGGEATWLATLAALHGPVRRVVVGADPGQTIGLAVLVDGEVYWVCEVFSAEAAAERLVSWRGALSPERWELHVGDGAPSSGRGLRKAVRAVWPDLPISVVSEARSSPQSPLTGSRHTDAAIHIAVREP